MNDINPSFAASVTAWPNKIDSIENKVKAHDDEALLAFYNLDNLSDEARTAIQEELQRRGHAASAILNWVPPSSHLSVRFKSRGIGVDPRTMVEGMTIFRIAIMVVTPFIFLFSIFVIGIKISLETQPYRRYVLSELQDEYIVYLLISVLIYIFLVIIGTFIASRRPARVLLLRPFGKRSMTSVLKKVVKRNFDGLGPVFTLSDRNYKPNHFLLLAHLFSPATGLGQYLLAPFFSPSFRIATVSSSPSFYRFARRISGGIRPNFYNFISRGQGLNIRTTDNWWRRCVDLLLNSCNLIVMDISRVSDGSAWEIQQMIRRGLTERCLFIVQDEYRDDGIGRIKELLPAGANPEVHVFRRNGIFQDSEAFRSDLRQKMAAVNR